MDISRSRSGKSCSQSSMLSSNWPPRHALALLPPLQMPPVGFCPTVGAGVDRTYWRRHLLQFSTNIFPCSSAKCMRCTPERKCRPSIFWLTMYFMWPDVSRAFRAMWHFDGTASSNEIFVCGFSPFFSNVQTPFGPRKSGMPMDVEIPAN